LRSRSSCTAGFPTARRKPWRASRIGEIDYGKLASATESYSGAVLAHLCESAVEYVLEESIRTGHIRTITDGDFERPLEEIRPSTRAWFDHARNYAMFANEGGAYDALLAYMKAHRL
jgi:SpoVK/Ycf46/Vps4 family AAA+-type ATPase